MVLTQEETRLTNTIIQQMRLDVKLKVCKVLLTRYGFFANFTKKRY